MLAVVVGLLCRRPALVHCLWLLVLLKLVTPPLFRVPISWSVVPEIREGDGKSSAVAFPKPVTEMVPERADNETMPAEAHPVPKHTPAKLDGKPYEADQVAQARLPASRPQESTGTDPAVAN